jgi:putative restriction endonuclease
VTHLADYLDLTVGQAREQFWVLLQRRPVQGGRQDTFLPVETLLCLAASFLVNHRRYGSRTAHQAPEPVPSLGRLFCRPPSSILAKMANLDGSRSHGGKWDALVGATLRDDLPRFSSTYWLLLQAARAEGIGPGRLPDFLRLEHGGTLERAG